MYGDGLHWNYIFRSTSIDIRISLIEGQVTIYIRVKLPHFKGPARSHVTIHLDYDVSQMIVEGRQISTMMILTEWMSQTISLSTTSNSKEKVSGLLGFQYGTHLGQKWTRRLITILGYEIIENGFYINQEGNEIKLTIQNVQLICFLLQASLSRKKKTATTEIHHKVYRIHQSTWL